MQKYLGFPTSGKRILLRVETASVRVFRKGGLHTFVHLAGLECLNEGIGNGQVFQLVHFLAWRQSTCLVKPADIHYQHAHPASSRTRRHRRVIWCCPCWWSVHFTYLFTQRSKGLASYLGRLTDWMRSWSNAPVERFHVIDFSYQNLSRLHASMHLVYHKGTYDVSQRSFRML